MRRLLITRGVQGAGKSHALRELGIDGHALSGDAIRMLLGGPVMLEGGAWSTYHDQESRVWAMLYDLLEERMARGELIAVDATHRRRRDFKRYLELARKHRYEVACLDFAPIPLELALARNRQRAPWAVVPEHILRSTWASCREGEVPEAVRRVAWSADGAHIDAIERWLSVPVQDLSEYTRIHHIGDLQGCFTPLKAYLDERGGLREDEHYIFIGDLCDRGIENAEVVRFVLDHHHLPNVTILWGNHEDHLASWADGEVARSDEFKARTAPQLEAAGIGRGEVKALCDALVGCVMYQWRGQRVLVTHAGLPTVPEHPERLSLRLLGRGTGQYGSPVDRFFSEQAPEGWVQVHGHRNPLELPILAAPRSYNLEGAVEHGGFLRCLTLDEAGFTPVEIPNRVYAPLTTRMAQGAVVGHKKSLPPWVRPGETPAARLTDEALAAMRDHPLIGERPSATLPHISSFNFTRDAFLDRQWDAINTTARGLFADTGTGEIVARSYDKFFNLGERPETQPGALAERLVFPVEAYVKENGYLGIVGYDPRSDQVLFATKSNLEGTFAQHFQGLFRKLVAARLMDVLRRFLRDTGSSMVFEVIDPEFDPHIIEYDAPRLILLDVIRRAPEFERAPYATLQIVGKRLGVEVKRKAGRFMRWPDLWGWLQAAQAHDYTFEEAHLEGFVIEDAVGFQTKIKLHYYQFWKRMRGLKDRVLRVRGTDKPLNRDTSDAHVSAFYTWCMKQSDGALQQSIVELRRAYLEGAELEGYEIPPPPPPREVVGFLRALDALSAQDVIKSATADALVAKALADDAKMAALRAHAVRVPLLLAASPGPERQAAGEAAGLDLDEPGEEPAG